MKVPMNKLNYKNTKPRTIIGVSLLALPFCVLLLSSCPSSSSDTDQKVVIVKASNIVKTSIGVVGMTCVGCEVTLEKNISSIEGVVSVKASHTEHEAQIEFDSTKTNIEAIFSSIEESGYQPSRKE